MQGIAKGTGEGKVSYGRTRSGLLLDPIGDMLHSTENIGISWRPLPGGTLSGGEAFTNRMTYTTRDMHTFSH